MTPIPPRFTIDDAVRASDEWGCNCGPSAIAAITNLTLDEVRPHLGDFESKRYTNPTLMWAALDSVGQPWKRVGRESWPRWGVVRVQWEGPWTKPGVPARAAYRHTHWVGACTLESGKVGIFDINALSNNSGWVSFAAWAEILVPWLLEEAVPRASGDWHITHVAEVAAHETAWGKAAGREVW